MRNKLLQISVRMMLVPLMVLSLVSIVGATNFSRFENDMATTSKVYQKLQADKHLMGSNINVETKNGEVTLTGRVKSNEDINRAAQLAGYVDGVRGVDNRLMTMSPNSSGSSRYGETSHASNCPVGANWSC